METQENPGETLGNHCKSLETPYTTGLTGPSTAWCKVTIPEGEYCIIRVDGRAFHTFTKPYKTKENPFCPEIIGAMRAAIESLIKEFSPVVTYSQSDEITVVIEPHKVPFGRRCHKLNSIAASVATAAFNLYLVRNSFNRTDKPATFDARSYGASKEDVLKVLIWRQRDAIKNSISAVARTAFSHKELDGKNSTERLAMLAEKGIRWESYPHDCIFGMTAFRSTTQIELDADWLRSQGTPESVIETLLGEGGLAYRSVIVYPDLPRFDRTANLEQVIFEQQPPLYTAEAAMDELYGKENSNENV